VSTLEQGFLGRVVGLGALLGQPNQGRRSTPIAVSPTTTRVTIAPANSKRIALLIQNVHASADCYIYFGTDTSPVAYLYHGGGNMTINTDLPWTGQVDAAGIGATAQLVGTEIDTL